MRVYACGGFGINIMSKYAGKQQSEVFEPLDICYIDTSESNLREKKLNNTVLFEGMDGSGKIRASNAKEISKRTLEILQNYKPDNKLNVVIHSSSGGSGSVISASIVSELKAQKQNVLVITVSNDDTIIEARNSFKTLESYYSIAKLRNSCIVMSHFENHNNSRKDTDLRVMTFIGLLCALYSNKHSELDSADLKTWLNVDSVISVKPTIAAINVVSDQKDRSFFTKTVSVATLAATGMNTKIEPTPAYQAVGYVPDDWINGNSGFKLLDKQPIDFCIGFDHIEDVYENLKEKVEDNERALNSITATNNEIGDGKGDLENGIVL